MITKIKFEEIGLSRVEILLEDICLTDEQFFQFCQENKHLKLERTKTGNIIIMTPTGLETSGRNSEIIGDLIIWNRRTKFGKVFDSNGGFTLPDNSMLAPDAAVVSQVRWDALPETQRKKFGRICPDFVVELKSESDRITILQSKMQDWLNNGVQLGWLIDPDNEKVYIYRPGKSMKEVNGFDNTISGESVLPGFSLDLSILR